MPALSFGPPFFCLGYVGLPSLRELKGRTREAGQVSLPTSGTKVTSPVLSHCQHSRSPHLILSTSHFPPLSVCFIAEPLRMTPPPTTVPPTTMPEPTGKKVLGPRGRQDREGTDRDNKDPRTRYDIAIAPLNSQELWLAEQD